MPPTSSAESNPSEVFRDESHTQLLDVIDKLRDLGLGSHINLPQLIVCGDTSSGKSSVLEAVSHIKFPVADEVCTRFATAVTLRRASDVTTTISIRPRRNATEEHLQKLNEFGKRGGDNLSDVARLITEAHAAMGLAPDDGFSNDVLNVSVTGPDQPNLTLVDLPGLIHADEMDPGSANARMISQLVGEYMRNPRSIILAVVSAQNVTSNQIILNMVQNIDPAGSRTIGVITKPDTLDHTSRTEHNFLRLASNEAYKLHLGWHVVRNASFQNLKDPLFDRDGAEKAFLSEAPWNLLPPGHLGIDSLRTRLVKCVGESTRAELPKLVEDIEGQISRHNALLRKLGVPRNGESDKRKYLTNIAVNYHSLVSEALNGPYLNQYFVSQNTKLRAILRCLEKDFADDMRAMGHTYDLSARLSLPSAKLNHQCRPLLQTREDMLGRVDTLIVTSRGRELSTQHDPRLIGPLFREQSMNWQRIALAYGDAVWERTSTFLEDLMPELCETSTGRGILQQIIVPEMERRRHNLEEKITELLTPYRKASPSTCNIRLEEEVRSLQKEMMAEEDQEDNAHRNACISLLSNCQAYYNIALETFIDTVVNLGVENCILDDLDYMISPKQIACMEPTELDALASETKEAIQEREYYSNLVERLRIALEACKKHAIHRPRSAPPRKQPAAPAVTFQPTLSRTNPQQAQTPGKSIFSPLTQSSTSKPSSIQGINFNAPSSSTSSRSPNPFAPTSVSWFGTFSSNGKEANGPSSSDLFGSSASNNNNNDESALPKRKTFSPPKNSQ